MRHHETIVETKTDDTSGLHLHQHLHQDGALCEHELMSQPLAEAGCQIRVMSED